MPFLKRKQSILSLILLHIILSQAAVIPTSSSNQYIQLELFKGQNDHHSLIKRYVNDTSFKLYNERRTEYLIKISVGTPPQDFMVSFDTGSSDTWIPSSKCSNQACKPNAFDSSKSSTFKPLNMSFSITYGLGSISADYAKDTMRLGNTSVSGQTFGLATSVADNIIAPTDNTITSSGILGLGFPALTANSDTVLAYDPFIFNLAKQSLIPEPIFGVYLGSMDATGWAGEVLLGAVNQSKYTGELKYVPVQQNVNPKTQKLDYTYWSVGIQDIKVIRNNQTTSITAAGNSSEPSTKNAMLDTGTTFTYLTKEMTDKIIELITQRKSSEMSQSNGLYVVDCNLKTTEAKLELMIASADTNQPVHWQTDVMDLIVPLSENRCGFGITYKENSLNDNFIIGDIILRSSYLVFDMGNKQVGLASAAGMKGSVF
ncbi:acid protease [Rhizopus microsporus ATCC 52813]|uniref:rhizopuspepsin n=1 Tax=Rhizopus microsporus ATCC 52813 TaxID=1340429 RepID=A0A2G4SVA2_RHIZD|nr:acid protease [Rhizopus microsporus ATCC 52813]PHZ12701.1 acid protease [Rhizopus microsporus ATCC 52813]